MNQNDTNPNSLSVGQDVTWWTGRGSKGRGKITKIEGDRVFIQPAEDSIKGSDYRVKEKGNIFWPPINTGIPVDQINTEPDPWYKGN